MTLLRHVLRTDIRQFRWPLLVWTLLVISEVALTGGRPSLGGDSRLYANLGMLTSLLWGALQIGMLLLVPIVVQVHPAVGTDAFWMTRPVPAGIIFASKALLLGLATVVMFCGARLALMLWIRVPAGEALLVTLDVALTSVAWLAILMAGAAITMNLSRFALLCGAVVASVVLLMTILIMRAPIGDGDVTGRLEVAGAQATLPPAEDPTAGVLFLVSLAGAGLGLAALQYRTRRRVVSIPVAVGGLLLIGAALPYWPLPLLRIQSPLPDWTGRPGALQLQATSSTIEVTPQPGWAGAVDIPAMGYARATLAGIEPGWAHQLEILRASLSLEDGSTLVSRRGYQSTPPIAGTSAPASQLVPRTVLGVEEVFGSPVPAADHAVVLALPGMDARAGAPVRGHYRGDFALRLAHWETVAALPLRVGTAFQDGSYRFAVEQITAGPGFAFSLRGREWRATSSFDRKPRITYAFYVRNAARTRALEGSVTEPFEGMGSFIPGLPFTFSSGNPSRFYYRTAILSFPVYRGDDRKIDWNPAWYADAELVLVRITDEGSVVRTLDIPGASLVIKQ